MYTGDSFSNAAGNCAIKDSICFHFSPPSHYSPFCPILLCLPWEKTQSPLAEKPAPLCRNSFPMY